MTAGFFDSHAHLLDERFSSDLDAVIEGVAGIISIFSPDEDMEKFQQLLKKNNIWGACGVHPHQAKDYDKLKEKLASVLSLERVVALGEIGLDFYYDNSPRDIQKDVFEKQLGMSAEKGFPVIVHSRQAFVETMDILKQYSGLKILFHCFSGSRTQMDECVGRGYYIAIGGVVTFPNAKSLREVAASIPIERLLLETDCPYLAPQQVRGKRNQPSYIKYVAEEIAGIRGESVEKVVQSAWDNTVKFFGLERV